MDGPEKTSFDSSARPLRVINILAFIPGIILLLITGISTKAGSFNFIAVAPLNLSALLGLICVAGKDKRMPRTMYADLCITMFFVSVLVPIWVTLAAHTNLWGKSEGLLCAYGTMPLTVDFCIHAYLFLRTIPNILIRACHQPRSCPNCKWAFPPPDEVPRWRLYENHGAQLRGPYHHQLELIVNDRFKRSHGDDTCDSNSELYHPSLANYQAGLTARESSEFQTSGCNTPRYSAETLNSSKVSGDVCSDKERFDSLV